MTRLAPKSKRPQIDELEVVFKALADKTRLRILALIGDNEVCVCHIHDSLGLPQPTVSRHLAYLRKTGLVDARRDGVWMHYRMADRIDPVVRKVVRAAVDAVGALPTTGHDRKQFERAFGELYVGNARGGGACCAPRASLG